MRLPVALVGCGLLLDGLADGSSALHGLGLGCRVLALALCAVTAVSGVGSFGRSPLALRFSFWRASGLLAAVLCIGLELLVRWPLMLRPTEGGFALDVVAILWIGLTAAVWDRASWKRLVPPDERRPVPAPGALSWPGLGTST